VRLTDRWLVWRLQRGDRDACRELVSRYHAGIYGYLRNLGADHPQAEDLTQETYAKAWRKIADLRQAASLRSWLLTIARNEFLQSVRRRQPAVESVDPLENQHEMVDPTPSVLNNLEDSEREQELRRAVRALEADLAEVVALHYFQALSLREIGSHLGLPVGTVKSRLHRALADLRASLKEEEKGHVKESARKTFAGTA
jgi:RNA polymerase sigma-70 factor, ECF subfamily